MRHRSLAPTVVASAWPVTGRGEWRRFRARLTVWIRPPEPNVPGGRAGGGGSASAHPAANGAGDGGRTAVPGAADAGPTRRCSRAKDSPARSRCSLTAAASGRKDTMTSGSRSALSTGARRPSWCSTGGPRATRCLRAAPLPGGARGRGCRGDLRERPPGGRPRAAGGLPSDGPGRARPLPATAELSHLPSDAIGAFGA
jgi:hypothetical protein